MYDVIDKSTLKPGDVVGVRMKTQIGWGFFRYPKTIPLTIERITPSSYQVRHDQRGRAWQERRLLPHHGRDEP